MIGITETLLIVGLVIVIFIIVVRSLKPSKLPSINNNNYKIAQDSIFKVKSNSGNGKKTCQKCNGTGQLICPYCFGSRRRTCRVCLGSYQRPGPTSSSKPMGLQICPFCFAGKTSCNCKNGKVVCTTCSGKGILV